MERPVSSPAVRRGGGLVDRRTHQRVLQGHRAARVHQQPGVDRTLHHVVVQSPVRTRTTQHVRLACVVGGREQQQALHRGRQLAAPVQEGLLDPGGEVERRRQCGRALELGCRELAGQLQEGQWVAACLRDSRWATSSAGSAPSLVARRARESSASRPVRTNSASPGASKTAAAPSRAANTIATRSAPSRRAQNNSAPALAGSNQCASSTTHSTRLSSAAAVSSDSVATPTRKGSTEGPSSSPNATRRARAWGGGSCSRSRASGLSRRCSAAKASGASTSSP